MKTKFEIVKDLVDNQVINFEEALILLDWEENKPQTTHQVSSPYSATISTTPNHTGCVGVSSTNFTTGYLTVSTQNKDVPFTLTKSNSDMEDK